MKRYTFRAIAGLYLAFILGTIVADIGEVISAPEVFTVWGAVKVVAFIGGIAMLAFWAGQESRTTY